mmetsp:Transcript_22548/g.38638  ORF Transcript_22548/g.38638 Transcript_22548/m.38638 type:complete len:167 (+) Transcript_22548:48-548(+)
MDLIVDFPQAQRRSPHCMKSRRVNFANRSKTYIVKNLSLQYKNEMWFSSQDMDGFKIQNLYMLWGVTSVLQVSVAQYAEETSHRTSTFMGLENYLSKDIMHQIKRRRKRILKAVLLEQRRQAAAGINDSDAMANVARRKSALGRKRARMIGLLHAENNEPDPLVRD